MGRHSAPDEDDAPLDECGTSPVALVERGARDAPAPSRGRHFRGVDPADAETGRIPPVTAPLADDPLPVSNEPAADPDAPPTEVSLDELIGATDDRAHDVTERIPPVVDDRSRPPAPAAPPVEASAVQPPVAEHSVTELPAPQPAAPQPAGLQPAVKASKRVGSPQVAVKHAAHNSAADLHLVRSSRTVLMLCALAVLIPFAVDLVVLTVLGDLTLRRFLVWIWAPLIAAGVLVGVVLDAGHRRHATP